VTSFVDAYFQRTAPHALKRSYPMVAGLHLNEMPRDIPAELKARILLRLRQVPLNRYPEPFADSLAAKLAGWYGCNHNQILVGPGSSSFIRLLLTFFGLHMQGKLVITRPSFAYYEQFCLAFGIDYDTWELTNDFQYDPGGLNGLPDYSVVFLTTPNNPTGNVLAVPQLERLLNEHARSLFLVDEAYVEFTSQNTLPLVETHDNLILLRTFSKAFGAAGLRCGALIGQAATIEAVGGLQTPWQLSPYTIEAAKMIVDYARSTNWIAERVQEVVTEREKLFERCCNLATTHFAIYPSHGNFLLFQGSSAEAHLALLAACADHHIRVEDLNKKPRLARCIRVTIGRPEENELFEHAFAAAFTQVARKPATK